MLIKGNGKTAKSLEGEHRFGETAPITRDIGKTIWPLASEGSFILEGTFTRDSGRRIALKDLVFS
jgi:hypothetical protein